MKGANRNAASAADVWAGYNGNYGTDPGSSGWARRSPKHRSDMQAQQSHLQKLDEAVITLRDSTLQEGRNITYDELRQHAQALAGYTLGAAEIRNIPSLNLILRKEQALTQYLVSFRERHAVWSVHDMEKGFMRSKLCNEHWHVQEWEALEVGDLRFHPVLAEIFPEIAQHLQPSSSQNGAAVASLASATEIVADLLKYRFDIGLDKRIELKEFREWYAAREGMHMEQRGVAINDTKLALIVAGQSAALSQQRQLKQEARARYLKELAKHAETDVLREVEEAYIEADSVHGTTSSSSSENSLWDEAHRLILSWRPIAAGQHSKGNRNQAYAGLTQWARYKLDTPPEAGPLPHFLRVLLAVVISKEPSAAPIVSLDDQQAESLEGSSVAPTLTSLPVQRHVPPNEIAEMIRRQLLEPSTVAQRPLNAKDLADLEARVLAGAPSFEALVGPGGASGFLRFIAEDATLRSALDQRLRSDGSGRGGTAIGLLDTSKVQQLPRLTCEALEQVAGQRDGFPGVLIDATAAADAERLVRKRLGLPVAAAEWCGSPSFVVYLSQCTMVRQQGWRLRLEDCGPLASLANQLRWVWAAGNSPTCKLGNTIAAHLGSCSAAATVAPPCSIKNRATYVVGEDTRNFHHLDGVDFEAVALAQLSQNAQAAAPALCEVSISDLEAGELEDNDALHGWESDYCANMAGIATELYVDREDGNTQAERDSAFISLLAVPYLVDVAEAVSWKQRFGPRLGSLVHFLAHAATKGTLARHGLRFMVAAPACFAQIKAEAQVLRVPEVAIESSVRANQAGSNAFGDLLERAVGQADARGTAAQLTVLCLDNPRRGAAQEAARYLQRSKVVHEDLFGFLVNVMFWLPTGIRGSEFGRNALLHVLKSEVGWEDRAVAATHGRPELIKMLAEIGRAWHIHRWAVLSIAETGIYAGAFDSPLDASASAAPCQSSVGAAKPKEDPQLTHSPNAEALHAHGGAGTSREGGSMSRAKDHEYDGLGKGSVTCSAPDASRITHTGHEVTCSGDGRQGKCLDQSYEEQELEKIRQGFLLGNADARQLQRNLGGSLERLSKDLSRDQHRFVHELLQNADDCEFEKGVVPTVELVLHDDHFVMRSNEVGFSLANVQALCSVDQSTKVGNADRGRELIGRKGIGFKAVFKVSDKPEVHSGRWQFCFDATLQVPGIDLKGLGYIVPQRLSATLKDPAAWWRTELRLPFRPGLGEKEIAHLRSDLNALDGTILLNLQAIQELRISQSIAGKSITYRRLRKQELQSKSLGGSAPPRVVRIFEEREASESFQDFLVTARIFAGNVQIKASLPLPSNRISSSDEWRRQELPVQQTYCFLPLRNFGWKFVLHANFDVTASRDDIHETSARNQEISRRLPAVLVDVLSEAKKLSSAPARCSSDGADVSCLHADDPLLHVASSIEAQPPVRCLPWDFALRFLPLPASSGLPGHLGSNNGDFFRGLEPAIWKRVKNEKCLLDLDGEPVEPHQTLAVPPNCHARFIEVFEPRLLWRLLNLRYLHPSCTRALPPRAEELLGIRGTRMAFRTILELLAKLSARPQQLESDTFSKTLNDLSWLRRSLALASALAFGAGSSATGCDSDDGGSFLDAHSGAGQEGFGMIGSLGSCASFAAETRRRIDELAKLRILPLQQHNQTSSCLTHAAGADGNIFFLSSAKSQGILLKRLVGDLGLRIIHHGLWESGGSDCSPGSNEGSSVQRLLQQLGVEELTPARLIACGVLPFLCHIRGTAPGEASVMRTLADCTVYIARFAEECRETCDSLLQTHSATSPVRAAWETVRAEVEGQAGHGGPITLKGAIRHLAIIPVTEWSRRFDGSDPERNLQILVAPGAVAEISLPALYHRGLAKTLAKTATQEEAVTAHIALQRHVQELFSYSQFPVDRSGDNTQSTCAPSVTARDFRMYVLGAAFADAGKAAYEEMKLGVGELVTFLSGLGVREVPFHAVHQRTLVDEARATMFLSTPSIMAALPAHVTKNALVRGSLQDWLCPALEQLLALRFGEGLLPRSADAPPEIAVSFCKVLAACYHLNKWSGKLSANLILPPEAGATGSATEADALPAAIYPVPSSLASLLRSAPWVPVLGRGQRPVDFPVFFASDALSCRSLLQQEFAIVDMEGCSEAEARLFRQVLEGLGVCEVRASNVIDLLRRWSAAKRANVSERLLTQIYEFIHTEEQRAGQTEMHRALRAGEPLIFAPNNRRNTKMSERAMEKGQEVNDMRGHWVLGEDCCIMILRDPIRRDSVGKVAVELSTKGNVRELELHYNRCLMEPFKAFGISLRAEASQLIRTVETCALKAQTADQKEDAIQWALWVYKWCSDANNVSMDGFSELRSLFARHAALLVVFVLPNLHVAATTQETCWAAWPMGEHSENKDSCGDQHPKVLDVYLPDPGKRLCAHYALSERLSTFFRFFECSLGMTRSNLALLDANVDIGLEQVQECVVSVPLVDATSAIDCAEEDQLLRMAASYLQLWLHERHPDVWSALEQQRDWFQKLEVRMGIADDCTISSGYDSAANVLSLWKPPIDIDSGSATHAGVVRDVLRCGARAVVQEVLVSALSCASHPNSIFASAEMLMVKCLDRLRPGVSSSPGTAAMSLLREYSMPKWRDCAQEAAQWPQEHWWLRQPPLPLEPMKEHGHFHQGQVQLIPSAGGLTQESGNVTAHYDNSRRACESVADTSQMALLSGPREGAGNEFKYNNAQASNLLHLRSEEDGASHIMPPRTHIDSHNLAAGILSAGMGASATSPRADARGQWQQARLVEWQAEDAGLHPGVQSVHGNASNVKRLGLKGFVEHMRQQTIKACCRAPPHCRGPSFGKGAGSDGKSPSLNSVDPQEVRIPEAEALFEDSVAVEDMPEEIFSFPQDTTEEQRAVGRWGEEFAFRYLRRLLGENWQVVWHNDEEEQGDWYDISAVPLCSTFKVTETQYFEVKSTCRNHKQHFDVSARQVLKADKLEERFTFLRICHAGTKQATIRLYHNPGFMWKAKEKTGVSLKVHLDDPA